MPANHKGGGKKVCTQGCFPAPAAAVPRTGGHYQKKFLQEVCEESERLQEGSWKEDHACIGTKCEGSENAASHSCRKMQWVLVVSKPLKAQIQDSGLSQWEEAPDSWGCILCLQVNTTHPSLCIKCCSSGSHPTILMLLTWLPTACGFRTKCSLVIVLTCVKPMPASSSCRTCLPSVARAAPQAPECPSIST